jgi:hypothetical protein
VQSSGQWSADSRFVAVVTSTNPISGGDNGTNKIFIYDCLSNAFTQVSINFTHTGDPNAPSDNPAMSADGTFVVYRSAATDIVAHDNNVGPKIFRYNRVTGITTVVSPADTNPFPFVATPAISAAGENVSFLSVGSSVVPGDLNRVSDAFVSEMDNDGDGIPDWWMQHFFGHPIGQAGDASLAQNDLDGDGGSNLQEYLSGTSPTDSSSSFRAQVSPGSNTLSWPASPSKNYQVQFKNDLTDMQWQPLPGSYTIVGNQAFMSLPGGQANQFYRIVITP